MSLTIPVRCFSCGKVLGDLWVAFNERTQKETPDIITEDNKNKFSKNFKGKILDELNVKRTCCRQQLLTTVNTNIYSLRSKTVE
jgi:DNA-directed RNA polymerase subunit N (RpoN/RPB10)